MWNGWKSQLLRTLYFETEPVITGGHSQISRDKRVAAAQAELAESLADWPARERSAYIKRHYPAYWLRVDLPRKLAHAAFIREADKAGRTLATAVTPQPDADITEITVLAPDHPRLLSIIAGACTAAGADIVDAQIFTTTDGRALDSISIHREFDDEADEQRRARRVGDLIEQALSGAVRLPEVIARKVQRRPRIGAFSLETAIHINNSLSNRFTVVETSGLDRPGLLYDLTRVHLRPQPQHQLGPHRHLRRARRRRLLCDRPHRRQDHQRQPRGGDPPASARRLRRRAGQGRAAAAPEEARAGLGAPCRS